MPAKIPKASLPSGRSSLAARPLRGLAASPRAGPPSADPLAPVYPLRGIHAAGVLPPAGIPAVKLGVLPRSSVRESF